MVYMGMRPGSAPLPSRVARLFGPLRRPVERFLAGGVAPSDPLYLTNRTFGQRLRTAVVVAVPCMILIGLVGLGVSSYIRVKDQPAPELTTAELKEKILPNLARNIQITTNRDLEVVEAHVETGPTPALLGTVRNNTGHAIEDARVVFDLTTDSGARLGAVAAKIIRVDAMSTTPFRIAVEQDTAAFALVREVVLP